MTSEEIRNWYARDGADFVRGLGVRPGERILDFGCGFGSYAIPLAQAVGGEGLVLALDSKLETLKNLKRCAATVETPAALRLCPSDGSSWLSWIAGAALDGVFLFDVLQHVEDSARLFQEILRTLRPGGKLYVNPSALTHPGKVDVHWLQMRLRELGFQCARRLRARVMHYKHMAEEELFVYAAPE